MSGSDPEAEAEAELDPERDVNSGHGDEAEEEHSRDKDNATDDPEKANNDDENQHHEKSSTETSDGHKIEHPEDEASPETTEAPGVEHNEAEHENSEAEKPAENESVHDDPAPETSDQQEVGEDNGEHESSNPEQPEEGERNEPDTDLHHEEAPQEEAAGSAEPEIADGNGNADHDKDRDHEEAQSPHEGESEPVEHETPSTDEKTHDPQEDNHTDENPATEEKHGNSHDEQPHDESISNQDSDTRDPTANDEESHGKTDSSNHDEDKPNEENADASHGDHSPHSEADHVPTDTDVKEKGEAPREKERDNDSDVKPVSADSSTHEPLLQPEESAGRDTDGNPALVEPVSAESHDPIADEKSEITEPPLSAEQKNDGALEQEGKKPAADDNRNLSPPNDDTQAKPTENSGPKSDAGNVPTSVPKVPEPTPVVQQPQPQPEPKKDTSDKKSPTTTPSNQNENESQKDKESQGKSQPAVAPVAPPATPAAQVAAPVGNSQVPSKKEENTKPAAQTDSSKVGGDGVKAPIDVSRERAALDSLVSDTITKELQKEVATLRAENSLLKEQVAEYRAQAANDRNTVNSLTAQLRDLQFKLRQSESDKSVPSASLLRPVSPQATTEDPSSHYLLRPIDENSTVGQNFDTGSYLPSVSQPYIPSYGNMYYQPVVSPEQSVIKMDNQALHRKLDELENLVQRNKSMYPDNDTDRMNMKERLVQDEYKIIQFEDRIRRLEDSLNTAIQKNSALLQQVQNVERPYSTTNLPPADYNAFSSTPYTPNFKYGPASPDGLNRARPFDAFGMPSSSGPGLTDYDRMANGRYRQPAMFDTPSQKFFPTDAASSIAPLNFSPPSTMRNYTPDRYRPESVNPMQNAPLMTGKMEDMSKRVVDQDALDKARSLNVQQYVEFLKQRRKQLFGGINN